MSLATWTPFQLNRFHLAHLVQLLNFGGGFSLFHHFRFFRKKTRLIRLFRRGQFLVVMVFLPFQLSLEFSRGSPLDSVSNGPVFLKLRCFERLRVQQVAIIN